MSRGEFQTLAVAHTAASASTCRVRNRDAIVGASEGSEYAQQSEFTSLMSAAEMPALVGTPAERVRVHDFRTWPARPCRTPGAPDEPSLREAGYAAVDEARMMPRSSSGPKPRARREPGLRFSTSSQRFEHSAEFGVVVRRASRARAFLSLLLNAKK